MFSWVYARARLLQFSRTWSICSYWPLYNLGTLRPFGAKLFSGLPRMIWKKFLQSPECTLTKSFLFFCQITKCSYELLSFNKLFFLILSFNRDCSDTNLQINLEAKRIKKIWYFYSICCRLSSFQHELLALTKIEMIWTFSQKANQNL